MLKNPVSRSSEVFSTCFSSYVTRSYRKSERKPRECACLARVLGCGITLVGVYYVVYVLCINLYFVLSHPDRTGSDRIGSERIGAHWIGSDRIALHRIALHRIAPHVRIASHRIHRIGSDRGIDLGD